MKKIVADWYRFHQPESDDHIEAWADEVIKKFKESKSDYHVAMSSYTEVNALRIRITRHILKPEELIFRYKGIDISCDKTGRLDKWPKGFADINDNYLMEMLEW